MDVEKNNKKYKLAIIAPVPFYYHVPLYRRLAESQEIDLMVYFCSSETLRSEEVERMYNVKRKFGTENNLLDGYCYKFIKNYSPVPSYMKWPYGLMNFGVCKEIIKGNYDLVVLQAWTNLTWWLAFLFCLLSKTPVVFMTDENILAQKTKPIWKKVLKRILVGNFIFRLASGFLTAGSANEDLYKYYGVPEKKLVRLHFSWDYEQFLAKAKELKPQRKNIRDSLGVKDKDFVILYVGRMTDKKNPFRLLDAFNLIKYPNKKLFFVGGGPLYSDIEKYIKDKDIKEVYLVGFQDRKKILDFYAAADIFILPSIYEPWGIVVNEAMCFSLPIIVSDKIGAGADLVKDGYNGFVFPSDDVRKLVDCFEKLINMSEDKRTAFGNRSFEIINNWIKEIDPAKQMIKFIETNKNK